MQVALNQDTINIMKICFNCSHEFPHDYRAYRSSICPACGREVKVCKNCRFFTPGAHWDCRETIPEPVKEKDRANFCDFFQFKNKEEENQQPKKAFSNRKSAEASLFGEDTGQSSNEQSTGDKSAFDSLFGEK